MDDVGAAGPEELEQNLRELSWTNRWFGGEGSLRAHLTSIRSTAGARVLDVGTGSGITLSRLRSWAEEAGCTWTAVGLDREVRFLGLRDRDGSVLPCVGDGLSLPFSDGAFDAVLSLQTLHHLTDEEIPGFLQEMVRVSKGPIVVSDLRRNLAGYLGARFLAAFVWRNALTRHDGPVSVRRGFSRAELLSHGKAAGVPNLAVHTHGPFRWVLTGRIDP